MYVYDIRKADKLAKRREDLMLALHSIDRHLENPTCQQRVFVGPRDVEGKVEKVPSCAPVELRFSSGLAFDLTGTDAAVLAVREYLVREIAKAETELTELGIDTALPQAAE